MREDRYTHTEADAGAYERAYAAEGLYGDDRPSGSDLAEEERWWAEQRRKQRTDWEDEQRRKAEVAADGR
jgi:hypothetical protein